MKLVGGPGLKFKSDSRTHLSETVCACVHERVYELNFDGKFTHTFPHTSGTVMPSHGCTSIHSLSGLNGEEK